MGDKSVTNDGESELDMIMFDPDIADDIGSIGHRTTLQMDEYKVLNLARLLSLKNRNEFYRALGHGKAKDAILEDIKIL
jgi:hypothetical protein